MTADNLGTTVDIPTEDMEVPSGMKLGGTGLVGDGACW